MSAEEAAQTEKYVLQTPNESSRRQDCKWPGQGPAPNAYMSPVDFTLSPMSMRLLRGHRSKVFVSSKLMGLSENPGFVVEPEADSFTDKENNGAVPLPRKVETLKNANISSKKGLSPATVNASPLAPGGVSKRLSRKGLSPGPQNSNLHAEMRNSPRTTSMQSR